MNTVTSSNKKYRMLLWWPTFPPREVIGLLVALKDLIQQLERHGWHIDVVSAPPSAQVSQPPLSANEQGSRAIHSPLDFLRQKLVAWHDFWAHAEATTCMSSS